MLLSTVHNVQLLMGWISMISLFFIVGNKAVHDPNWWSNRSWHRRRVHLGRRIRGWNLSKVEARQTLHRQHGQRRTKHQRQSGPSLILNRCYSSVKYKVCYWIALSYFFNQMATYSRYKHSKVPEISRLTSSITGFKAGWKGLPCPN